MKLNSATNKYILWIGSLLEISDLENGLPASTAAVRWQTGLANGIIDQGIPIHCINKLTDLYWPHGPFFLGRKKPRFFRGITGLETRFLNLPKIRTILMARAYSQALQDTIKEHKLPEVAIFYNVTVQNIDIFNQLKHKLNIPCVILAADMPAQNSNEFKIYQKACKEADGIVYLSRSEFEKSSIKNKIHLDGGISGQLLQQRLNNIPRAKPYLMYTGAFEPYCGVNLILDALDLTKNDFQLVICGKCRYYTLLTRFKNHPRVDYKGFVSEEELENLSHNTFGFVNSYLPSAAECEGKFPSKIFEYLSYGRPVISTLTSGIAPEYEEVLHSVNDEDPVQMALQFDKVFDLYKSGSTSQIKKNKKFLKSRTWEHQTERFIDFINQSDT